MRKLNNRIVGSVFCYTWIFFQIHEHWTNIQNDNKEPLSQSIEVHLFHILYQIKIQFKCNRQTIECRTCIFMGDTFILNGQYRKLDVNAKH